jgi:hypothetical protein
MSDGGDRDKCALFCFVTLYVTLYDREPGRCRGALLDVSAVGYEVLRVRKYCTRHPCQAEMERHRRHLYVTVCMSKSRVYVGMALLDVSAFGYEILRLRKYCTRHPYQTEDMETSVLYFAL